MEGGEHSRFIDSQFRLDKGSNEYGFKEQGQKITASITLLIKLGSRAASRGAEILPPHYSVRKSRCCFGAERGVAHRGQQDQRPGHRAGLPP